MTIETADNPAAEWEDFEDDFDDDFDEDIDAANDYE